MQVQWGSEYWARQVFEWLKIVRLRTGLVFKWWSK